MFAFLEWLGPLITGLSAAAGVGYGIVAGERQQSEREKAVRRAIEAQDRQRTDAEKRFAAIQAEISGAQQALANEQVAEAEQKQTQTGGIVLVGLVLLLWLATKKK